MTNKEINQFIGSLLDIPKSYDLRCEFRIISPNLSWVEAESQYQAVEPELKHLYSITTAVSNYNPSDDIETAIEAAQSIADKYDYTFVLTYTDGRWRAAYGDYKDCEEVIHENPAYATSMSIVNFFKEHK